MSKKLITIEIPTQTSSQVRLMYDDFQALVSKEVNSTEEEHGASNTSKDDVLAFLRLRNRWKQAQIVLRRLKRLERDLSCQGISRSSIDSLNDERARLAIDQQLASDRHAETVLRLDKSIAQSMQTLSKINGNLGDLRVEYKLESEKTADVQSQLVSLQKERDALKMELTALKKSDCSQEVNSKTAALELLDKELGAAEELLMVYTSEATDMVLSAAVAEAENVRNAWIQKVKEQMDQNRTLRNEVLSRKRRIRVFCRVRQLLGRNDKPVAAEQVATRPVDGTENEVQVSKLIETYKGAEVANEIFSLDKVFGPQQTNYDVFFEIEPLLQNMLLGNNVCIFAYGQTSAGKTHTMTSENGIVPQSAMFLFQELESLGLTRYEVSCEACELYLDQVNDLLSEGRDKDTVERTGSELGHSLTSRRFIDPEDVVRVIEHTQQKRKTMATASNNRSSRSHFIFTLNVQIWHTEIKVTRGTVKFVDLAGSERIFSTEAARVKETKAINSSLSALATVIQKLHEPHSHIPYRANKLTRLLSTSLTPSCKILMLVHVAPESRHVNETLNTLRFAAQTVAD